MEQDTKENRIKRLEDHIKVINTTIYPDNSEELVDVMLTALGIKINEIKREDA